jgi:hypothetical protein
MDSAYFISVTMEGNIFGEHPVDHPGEFPGGGHDGLAFTFLFGNTVIETGKKTVRGLGDVDPGALDKEIADGGGSLFGDVSVVVDGG